MSSTSQSMPPEYKEEWEVVTSLKDKYVLDEKQMKILRQAIEQGNRGMIFFRDFAFSIAHIVEINLLSKQIKNQLPGQIDYEVSDEEAERVARKIEEFKKDFIAKHKMPRTRMSNYEVNKRRNKLLDQGEKLDDLN